jgi:hypothetical protein
MLGPALMTSPAPTRASPMTANRGYHRTVALHLGLFLAASNRLVCVLTLLSEVATF